MLAAGSQTAADFYDRFHRHNRNAGFEAVERDTIYNRVAAV